MNRFLLFERNSTLNHDASTTETINVEAGQIVNDVYLNYHLRFAPFDTERPKPHGQCINTSLLQRRVINCCNV